MKVASGDLLLDVLRGGDGCAGAVGDGLAADVGTGTEAGGGEGFGPGEEVGGLFGGQQAASFFLVEKDEGVGWEAFALGGCCGGECVFLALGGGSLRGALRGRLDLGFGAAVGEDEEAEALGEQRGPLAGPGVVSRAGWVGEPEAGEVEVTAQGGEGGVAGVEVAVEADVGFGGLGIGCDRESDQGEDGSQVAGHVDRIPAGAWWRGDLEMHWLKGSRGLGDVSGLGVRMTASTETRATARANAGVSPLRFAPVEMTFLYTGGVARVEMTVLRRGRNRFGRDNGSRVGGSDSVEMTVPLIASFVRGGLYGYECWCGG